MFRYSIFLICFTLLACEQKSPPKEVKKRVEAKLEDGKLKEEQIKKEIKKEQSYSYTPFPKGYGYMQNLKQLQEATDQGKRDIIRDHAWKLWAGIMQPDENLGWPLWYSWPNTKAAFKAKKNPSTEMGMSQQSKKSASIRAINHKNKVDVDTHGPIYDIPKQVVKDFPNGICKNSHGVNIACDGPHFLFNGDIMIPTESLSKTAMKDIRGQKLYLQSTLNQKHKDKVHELNIGQRSIVTKHMYWPVKASGITAIPVWQENFPVTFEGYAGYEKWKTLVAIDPSGKQVGKTVEAEFLYKVKDRETKKTLPPVKGMAKVYSLEDFYYHKITKKDWASFNESDKAVLTSSSIWANNQTIGPGDYLITIAMHVNTKELPSWTLQSVWWSDQPHKGQYAKNRPTLPQAKGPWDHYLLTDSYAVPANKDGNLDIAVNPYIEGVTHPIATSCRNCHVRAGWPTGDVAGTASYQNPDCDGLLTALTPQSECLKKLTLSDYLWIIPDRAVKD